MAGIDPGGGGSGGGGIGGGTGVGSGTGSNGVGSSGGIGKLQIRGDRLTQLRRTHGGTLENRDDGSVVGREVFYCLWKSVSSLMPKRNKSQHPDFSTLICSTAIATRMKPGIVAKIDVTYSGFLGGDPGQDDWVQELAAATRQEPIETHPDFVAKIGGKKGAELNDAVFDDDGKFVGFKQTSKFAGVKSWLVCGTSYRIRRTSSGRPNSIKDVGTRKQPAIGIATPEKADWLLVARTWRRSGGVYEINEEWQLSGPKGWDTTIYK